MFPPDTRRKNFPGFPETSFDNLEKTSVYQVGYLMKGPRGKTQHLLNSRPFKAKKG